MIVKVTHPNLDLMLRSCMSRQTNQSGGSCYIYPYLVKTLSKVYFRCCNDKQCFKYGLYCEEVSKMIHCHASKDESFTNHTS